MYDTIIVGAGPAGLSAAITCKFLKMNFIVLCPEEAGGALRKTYPWKTVEGVLGEKDKNGAEVSRAWEEHARAEGVEFVNEDMKGLRTGESLTVITTNKEYKTRSLILAIGCMGCPRTLGIKGENLKGVHYSLLNPEDYKGERVVIVGGGDSAVETATKLDSTGASVTLIHRRDELRAGEKNQNKLFDSGVRILFNTESKLIIGDKKVEGVKVINNRTGDDSVIECRHVFVFIGNVPNERLLDECGIAHNERGVIVDADLRTNVRGVFAAGDITGNLKRIAWAIGEGCKAAFSAYKFVRKPYWG